MYTDFFGLREKPFSLTPNPRFLYLTDAHKEALAHLLYGLEQGEGFIVITGEVGTGKTTLCRSLLERIDLETEVAILFNPSQNAQELLQSINEEFGLPVEGLSRRQLLSSLNRFLLDRNAEGQHVVLIIDEAQNLSLATLEQVRLLSNLETAANKLIQIILLGQPELDEKLDSDELRQLRQRVSVRWCLEPMTVSETGRYIQHRLKVAAGADREILTAGALVEIHRLSGGIPRLVNALSDRVLLAGYSAGRSRPGRRWVRRAAREIPGIRRPWIRTVAPSGVVAAVATVLLLVAGATLWPGWVVSRGTPEVPMYLAAPPDPVPAEKSISEPPVVIVAEVSSSPVEQWSASALESGSLEVGQTFPRELPASVMALAPPLDQQRIESEWAEGGFLSAMLADTDHSAGVGASTRALMDLHGVTGGEELITSVAGGISALRRAGLGVTEFEDTDLTRLVAINYPALLELQTGSGEMRAVGLLSVEGEIAELGGVGQGESLSVSISALEDQWTGLAWVIWRPYLDIPKLIGIGEAERGAGVLWLQEALSRLGYPEVRITGTYDEATTSGVESFQQEHDIEVDGLAGPFTQMLIYGALEEYTPPRLQDRGQG